MLSLHSVIKSYAGRRVIDDLTIDIPAGKTTAMIGPSGCGKSTLLRLLTGLIIPDSGEVKVNGQNLTKQNLISVRHQIGYVIQQGGLFPHLTNRDNLALLPRHVGRSSEQIQKRIQELQSIVQLENDVLDRHPQSISGGQRQRVALMRALMLDPPILLFDEPLGALDPIVRNHLQHELKGFLISSKKTAIIVTHDLYEAAYLSDQIALMSEGKIVQCGSMEDLKHQPQSRFVTEFIESQRHHLTI